MQTAIHLNAGHKAPCKCYSYDKQSNTMTVGDVLQFTFSPRLLTEFALKVLILSAYICLNSCNLAGPLLCIGRAQERVRFVARKTVRALLLCLRRPILVWLMTSARAKAPESLHCCGSFIVQRQLNSSLLAANAPGSITGL